MNSNIYKLLSVSTTDAINIGDFIQAVAASQFYPNIDGFIEREHLKDYQEEYCKTIMNAWYMHNPKQWPPSERINPLFVAMHINSSVEKEFLAPASINYLKKHQPIGCRDKRTAELLTKHGVEAYFSGCLTLTLGKKYYNPECDGTYYFVDAYSSLPQNLLLLFKILILSIVHIGKIIKLSKIHSLKGKNPITRFLKIANFYKEYSKLFTDEILLNAQYITQQDNSFNKKYTTPKELFLHAEELVKRYAKAKLVVTSRIHCALPCLGLETPVLYIHNENGKFIDDCRLTGLKELFNIISWRNHKLEIPRNLSGRINKDSQVCNKEDWQKIAHKLIKTCDQFTI